MGFQVSPGVEVKEIDLTNVIPAVSTSIGGYSGYFRSGPVNEVTTISSEKELASKFGTPDAAHTQSFLTAASFLKYGNALKVVRAGDSNMRNAVAGTHEVPSGGIEGVAITSQPAQFNNVTGTEQLTIVETTTSGGNGATIAPRYDVLTPTASNIGGASGETTGYKLEAGDAVNVTGLPNNSSPSAATDFTVDIQGESVVITITGGDDMSTATGVIKSGSADIFVPSNATTTFDLPAGGVLSTVGTIGAADANRTAGTYTVTHSGNGADVAFTIVVDDTGAATVTVTSGGFGYSVGDNFLVPDSDLGGGGAADLTFQAATVVANVAGAQIDTGVFTAVPITLTTGGVNVGDTITVFTTSGLTTSPAFTLTVSDSGNGQDPDFALAAGVGGATNDPVLIGEFDVLTDANKSGLKAFDSNGAVIPGLFFDATYKIALIASLNDGGGYVVANVTVAIDGVSLEAGNFTFDEQESEFKTAELIENESAFEALYPPASTSVLPGLMFARSAGTMGNSLAVYVLDAGTFSSAPTSIQDQFDAAPTGTEVHVFVFDEGGEITGTAGSELEKYSFLDTTAGAKLDDGSNNNVKDVLNEKSAYIYMARDTAGSATAYSFDGGIDVVTPGSAVSADILAGLSELEDSELVDVNLLFAQADTTNSLPIGAELQRIAFARKDAVAFVSTPIATTTGNATAATDVTGVYATSSVARGVEGSYAFLDSTALYVYNKYADNYVYIPASGHMAGLCAKTDGLAEPWFSPAGFNRGALLGVTKLGYNPKKADRDTLYKGGVNPIVSFPGEGIVLFGDKTAQAKPSAFDRINVRRLFAVLEKAIATAAKFQLFELNDEFTRAMFRNMTEPFLRDVKGRRGITDFLVVCDETNNTGEIIDSNRFVADIFIKPARSINFITLNFIATRTGVEFSEIVGK